METPETFFEPDDLAADPRPAARLRTPQLWGVGERLTWVAGGGGGRAPRTGW